MAIAGRYEIFDGRRHFIPSLLGTLPVLEMSGEVLSLFGEAMENIGKLENAAASAAYPRQIVRAYVMKEALMSSEIEGTVTTFSEVMEARHANRTTENRDVRDVLNYIEAAWKAVKMLQEEGLPLVERVVRTAHEHLLRGTAGESKNPGVYRDGSVMVGKHVPPPASYISDLMRDLEKFLNSDAYPPLLKAGIAHVQFETIHPFWDGNGRIGRLLIVLTLLNDGVIAQPLLYPSYYFKRFRSDYYAYLDGIRRKGDWRSWLRFYLRAVNETASDMALRMERIAEAIEAYRVQIAELSVKSGDALLDRLLEVPVFSVNQLAESMGYSFAGANGVIKKLEEAGIAKRTGAGRRFRRYRLERYMEILEADTAF
jgi:Fic family protein